MTGKFFWYELMTSDRTAAETFYDKVIGLTSASFGDSYTVVEAGGRGIGGLMTIPPEAADGDSTSVEPTLAIVEADADPVALGCARRNLVAQPAFP